MYYVSKKRTVVLVCVLALLLVALVVVGSLLCYRFFEHEYGQQDRIQNLESDVAGIAERNTYLETKVATIEKILTDVSDSNVIKSKVWSISNYNYLAIGNSITRHGKCDYWWNDGGMAATKTENDYVHKLGELIEKDEDIMSLISLGGGCDICAVGFSVWETQSSDRAETLSQLDSFLDDRINLVTIQLGENAYDLITFEPDFIELIEYVKERCPVARIVVVGDFWEYSDRDSMKVRASDACGVEYIDLSEIKNNIDYYAGMGTVVYDDDGGKHIIEHEGVAAHPSDKAMSYIAEKIFERL